jgi:Flp pilus assembly protein TadG
VTAHLRTLRRREGQSVVEFALVSMLMIVVVLGIIDFSYLFAGRAGAYQATRVAARFAATHPAAWTSSANPDRTTIEGNLVLAAIPARVPNDDAHVTISYLVPGAGSPTLCGSWSAAAGAFQPRPGYTQANCVVPGNLIRIQATYVYRFITPLLSAAFSSVTITTQASALEEL